MAEYLLSLESVDETFDLMATRIYFSHSEEELLQFEKQATRLQSKISDGAHLYPRIPL